MIYNTTLVSGSENSWKDTEGRTLTKIGNQNLYPGKIVWTDGKIIYGYDVYGYLSRKVNKIIEKLNDVIFHVSIYHIWYLDFSDITNVDIAVVAKEKLQIPDNIFVSENKFYYYEISNNDLVMTELNGNSLQLAISSSHDKFDRIDVGRNGGIVGSEKDWMGNSLGIFYFNKEMTNGYYNSTSYVLQRIVNSDPQTYQNARNTELIRFFNLNVDDNGNAIAMVEVYYESYNDQTGHYEEHYKYYRLESGQNGFVFGNFSLTVPAGDGIATYSINYTTEKINKTGTVDIEIDSQHTITLPINTDGKLTLTKRGIFVYTPHISNSDGFSNFEFKFYDLTGNMLWDFNVNPSIHGYGNINDFRLNFCNAESRANNWGYS